MYIFGPIGNESSEPNKHDFIPYYQKEKYSGNFSKFNQFSSAYLSSQNSNYITNKIS